MAEKITLVTCTGSRTEAFELCQRYMAEQTVSYDQWIVVHDGITPEQAADMQENYPYIELHAGPRTWREGLNTHRFNMEEALKHIKGDYIFIIEDDDYYAPEYLEEMVKLLKAADIVGLSNNKYYNLSIPGWKEMGNFKHSSLCTTAMRKSALPLLQRAVDSGDLYFDMVLWQLAQANRLNILFKANSSLSVGIKGMPGRAGIGAGHRFSGFSIDPNLDKLTEWLGTEGVLRYSQYAKKFTDGPSVPAPQTQKNIAQRVTSPRRPAAAIRAPQVIPTAKASIAPKIKAPIAAQPSNTEIARQVPPMSQSLPPKLSGQGQSAARAQSAAMAMMPQNAGVNPSSAELIQGMPQPTAPSYPTGERGQGDIYK